MRDLFDEYIGHQQSALRAYRWLIEHYRNPLVWNMKTVVEHAECVRLARERMEGLKPHIKTASRSCLERGVPEEIAEFLELCAALAEGTNDINRMQSELERAEEEQRRRIGVSV